MSRHTIPPRDPTHVVTAGWDNSLGTFFAIVERASDDADDEDGVVFWLGADDREFPRAEDMIKPLAPYADLTPEIIQTLRADRAATLDRGPTPLQRLRFR
jgi:hypothetical protein